MQTVRKRKQRKRDRILVNSIKRNKNRKKFFQLLFLFLMFVWATISPLGQLQDNNFNILLSAQKIIREHEKLFFFVANLFIFA